MTTLEALCDLLFELSNDDRLLILYELRKNPQKLSTISTNLGFTAQATARNIGRLVENGLIKRSETSDYILTPYGNTSLSLLDSFHFISENKEYMLTHWTDRLPPEFQVRIGDLRNCERIDDPLKMMANMERVFKEAEVYHQYISPFRAMSHKDLQYVVDKMDEGLQIRNIEETNYEVPANAIALVSDKVKDGFKNHWKKGNMKIRCIDKINIRINMSEKEVSILTFPKLNGEVDMFGFSSSDPIFHKWCSDLFEYYWEKGKTAARYL